MAVGLKDVRGEGFSANNVDGFAVFLQFVYQGDKVAIAADDGKGVDMGMGKSHLQGVERQVDVSAILVTARAGKTLDHLDRVFRHLSCCAFLSAPVCVGEFCNNIAPLFQRV